MTYDEIKKNVERAFGILGEILAAMTGKEETPILRIVWDKDRVENREEKKRKSRNQRERRGKLQSVFLR